MTRGGRSCPKSSATRAAQRLQRGAQHGRHVGRGNRPRRHGVDGGRRRLDLPAERHERLDDLLARVGDAADAGAAPSGSDSFPPSSSSSRAATLAPTPGTRSSAFRSPAATAVASAWGSRTDNRASARRGPTPWTDCSVSNMSRSWALSKPKSVSESSRTTRCVARLALLARAQPRERRRRGEQSVADARHVEHDGGRPDAQNGACQLRDHREPFERVYEQRRRAGTVSCDDAPRVPPRPSAAGRASPTLPRPRAGPLP